MIIYEPRSEAKPCKHCGRPVTSETYPVHAEGFNRGKSRCNPADSGLPIGYHADPEGADCTGACVGSARRIVVAP